MRSRSGGYDAIDASARTAIARTLTFEGIWVAGGQVAAVAGALVGIRLITEVLDPAAYGELALGLTIANLANQTIVGPLTNGISRYYAPSAQTGDVNGYLAAARWLFLAGAGATALLSVLAVLALVATDHRKWIAIALAALLYAFINGCSTALMGIFNAARMRRVVAFHQGIEPCLRFTTAALLATSIAATSTMAMIGFVVSTLVMTVSQWAFFTRLIRRHATSATEPRDWRTDIWRYSWPFSAWGLFSWAQQSTDRWALEVFATTDDVGRYAVLYQLGYQPTALAAATLLQLLTPILFERAGDARDRNRNAAVNRMIWRVTLMILTITVAMALLAGLFHAAIVGVLAAKEYSVVQHLLPWMLLAGGVFAAGQAISLGLMSQLRSREMIVAKIATSLLGIGLNVAGARLYGLDGVVFAGVLYSAVYLFWMAVLAARTGRNAASAVSTLDG